MEIKQRNEKYNAYVNARIPKTHAFPTLLRNNNIVSLILVPISTNKIKFFLVPL